MGCCFSHPSGPNAANPGAVGSAASSRALAEVPQPNGASQTVGDVPLPHSNPSRRPRRPLDQHINKPLRRHAWTSRETTWTREALRRERRDFFDTRVAGRPEAWQTLHVALRVLWDSDGDDDDDDEAGSGPDAMDAATALATAQSILDAAGMTLPTGDLAAGAYDALGNYYALPEHVVADPTNLVSGPRATQASDVEDSKADLSGAEETPADAAMHVGLEEDGAEDEVERRREEKGKGVMDMRHRVTVRARLSDTSRDVDVSVGETETVRSIACHVADEAKLPSHKRVRIAYMGKMLRENSPLLAQGWNPSHVVNALVFER